MQRMSVRINMTVSNKIIAIQAGVVSSVLKFTRPLVQPSSGIKLEQGCYERNRMLYRNTYNSFVWTTAKRG